MWPGGGGEIVAAVWVSTELALVFGEFHSAACVTRSAPGVEGLPLVDGYRPRQYTGWEENEQWNFDGKKRFCSLCRPAPAIKLRRLTFTGVIRTRCANDAI